MLWRSLAAGVLVLAPGFAAAQTLPPTYQDCLRAEDPVAGIAACEEALRSSALLQSERARGYVTLARYQRQTGALSAALANVDKAAEIAPNAGAIPAERAVILHLSGDLAGAEEAHARAFALDSGSVAMLNNRGVTMLALGDAAAAIADFDAALAMIPDATVLANRAAAKCSSGDAEGSMSDRMAAIELDEAGGGELEATMAKSGFAGGLGTGAPDAAGALAQWTAAGCPGAASPGFF